MKVHKWKDVKQKKLSKQEISKINLEIQNEILEMNLKSVRELIGKTQQEVAYITDMNQSELSRIENRNDHLISTLKRYIEALGGDLEVTAKFGDKSVRLRGI